MVEGLGRRIVVVDDEPMLRTLISDRLRANGFDSWPAEDAFEARKLVTKHDPDAMIVDLDLGQGPTGIELIVSMAQLNPNLGFVLLTNFTPTPWELQATPQMTYVRKSEVREFTLLLDALETVLRDAKGKASAFSSPATELSALTKKQLKLLELMAKGLSNPEIAVELGVSLGGVEQISKRMYAALGLQRSEGKNRRVQAVQMFIQNMGPRRRN